MALTMTIQVRGRGTLTLPATLREKYRLGEGDPLTVVDLDGAVRFLSYSVNGTVFRFACQRDDGKVFNLGDS